MDIGCGISEIDFSLHIVYLLSGGCVCCVEFTWAICSPSDDGSVVELQYFDLVGGRRLAMGRGCSGEDEFSLRGCHDRRDIAIDRSVSGFDARRLASRN